MKIHIIGVVILTLLCYLNSLGSGFVWDDINNVVNSERLEKAEGLSSIFLSPSAGFYRPLSYLSLKFDYFFWAKKAFGYHLTNVIFHILNVILIFFLVKVILKSKTAATVSASLFAVHPVHTEAVTYISGRSDVISGFFIFLSFYLFILFLNTTFTHQRRIYYASSLFIFTCSLLSKESAVLLPLLMLGYISTMQNRPFLQAGRKILPFVIGSLLLLIFRQHLLTGMVLSPNINTNITNMFKTPFFYLSMLVFPVNLHMQRSLSEFPLLMHIPFWFFIIISVVIGLVIKKLTNKKIVYFALFWFLISLLPFLGWLKYSAQIAEHWLYIPSFGIFLLTGRVLMIKRNKVIRGLVVLAVVVFSILTIRQNTFWQDDLTLYKYTLKFRSDDPKLHYNLGNAYLRRNMLDQAQLAYEEALRLKPDYAYALNNLGIVFETKGNDKQAFRLYQLAEVLDPEAEYSKDNVERFSQNAIAYEQEEKVSFDHSLYAQLLAKYTDNGWVDYAGLSKNPILLYRYLRKISMLDKNVFSAMGKNERKALYINAYNAFTIKAIIDHYPVESIQKIPGVWKKLEFVLAQEKITLDEIEHGILRPEFKDARVHFALVCAARGCPRLRRQPYQAKSLDRELDDAGREFLNDSTRNKLDKQKNILYLSSIFKWFKNDFDSGNLINFISRYLPAEEVGFIKKNKPKIKYQYNWSLNEKE